MARVLLISPDKSEYSVIRILSEIMERGIECTVLTTDKLSLVVSAQIQPIENWLSNFSFVVFRNFAGSEWSFVRAIRYAMLSSSPHLIERVLNGESYYKFPVFSKLVQAILLRSAGLITPYTVYMAGQNEFPFDFPCVVKAIFGNRGRDVHLVKEPSDWHRLCRTYGVENLIMQEYLPGIHDYRALVIGEEVVALHKRVAPTGDFRTNFAVGGLLEKVEQEIVDEIKEIALAAARVFRCDFCGVDLRYGATRKLNVLEINRSADFEGMEEIMGIPASKYLSEYIIKKADMF